MSNAGVRAAAAARAGLPLVTLVALLTLAGAPARAAGAQAPARGASPPARALGATAPAALAGARQLLLVTAGGWDAVDATLRRYERAAPGAPWRAVGGPVPVTLGGAGMAWGAGQGTEMPNGPSKREGDGRAPAGAFPLLAAFGYGPADTSARLPYHALTAGTVCVDDPASPLYNAVVDSAAAGGARWASAERMRRVAGYRQGVVVGYNGAWVRGPGGDVRAPGAGGPRPGAGSCIFLHVWDGPGRPTAGCTAMDAAALAAVVAWLDPRARPALVQLAGPAREALRRAWGLP